MSQFAFLSVQAFMQAPLGDAAMPFAIAGVAWYGCVTNRPGERFGLRANKAHFGQALAALHFDAHCDAWTDQFGEPSGHGTWVYEAI